MHFLSAISALIAVASAISVNAPAMNAVWTAGQDQTISWTSVNTDPSAVSIYLVNFSKYPTQTIPLQSNVAVSSGSITISGSYLTPGTGYQINIVPGTNTQQILAQSNQFSIVAAAGTSTTAAAVAAAAATSSTGSGSSAATSSAGALPVSNSTISHSTNGGSHMALSGSALVLTLGTMIFV